MKKIILAALIVLLTVPFSVLANGQSSSGDSSNDETTLTWQIWVTPNLPREDKDALVAAFESEHPGVKVELIELSATNSANAEDFARERLAAGDLPDILSNFTDIPAFAEEGLLWPLPADDPDLKVVNNLMSTAYKGKIYSYMSAIQPQGIIYYNKEMWKDAGLTDADIPKTWDEFESVCQSLKDAGFTPIVTGGEWVPVIFWDFFMGAELSKNHPELWEEVKDGTFKWNSPEGLTLAKRLDDLAKKGYIIDGALSIGYAQLEQAFLNGAGALYPMGSWFTAAEAEATASGQKSWSCGAFSPPTLDGKTNVTRSFSYGNGYVITSKCENPELAFELVKKITLDPVWATKALQADGMYSNTTPPMTYPMTDLQQELQEMIDNADYSRPILQHRLGIAPPPGIGDYMTSAAEAIISQSYTSLEDVLQTLDDYCEEALETGSWVN